ncbi:unnamed protein product [Discosporangium mesarthrocarpum]
MVNGERYKKLMIEAAIPAIKACMPRPEGHTKVGIMKAIEEPVGGDIVIETQPANSPDLNVNDLGLFHSIQQLKKYVGVTTMQELVEATAAAFDV